MRKRRQGYRFVVLCRRADTGKFCNKSYALANPDTTIRHTYEVRVRNNRCRWRKV